jgi:two-component system, OmpR family, response regulator CpxR
MPVATQAKKRLLCVDHHEEVCDLLIALLADYDVTPASTAADGLRLARGDRFDLILLARQLPDGEGIELCRHFRDSKPRLPILFFSGADYDAGRECDLPAEVPKCPVMPDDLRLLEPTIARLIREAESGLPH